MSTPKIFGWMADSTGCGHYRIALPLAEYSRRGGDATWAEIMPPEVPETADIIIGQRVCKEAPTTLWQRLCSQRAALMVLELDDDLFNVDHSNTAAHQFYGTPGILDNLKANIRVADLVTVTTGTLADVVRAYNPNVAVVPNRVPAWLLSHARPRAEHVTIGWGGSGSHAMDWADVAPQIARFLWRNEHVHAHMVGGKFDSMRNWPWERVRITQWKHTVEQYYKTIDFDIGLAPLRPHIFNQSKSPIKTLEYAALGIPVVASAAGPYADFVKHGQTGYLVSRDHEWLSFIRELANDPQQRAELGDAAHRLAANNTVESNLSSWTKAWGIELPGEAKAA